MKISRNLLLGVALFSMVNFLTFAGGDQDSSYDSGSNYSSPNQVPSSSPPAVNPGPSMQSSSIQPRPDNVTPTVSSGSLYSGDGGKGIVITVPTPNLQNGTKSDTWIPQLFQDIITGDLARYSAMTVIDRTNESLVLAEQQLSVNGNYSDQNYITMGQLTNAQYIVAGTILNMSGRYSVSFRINNTETNEIKTSYNKQYLLQDIERGLAAKETAKELLAGMGVVLTEYGEKQLLTIQDTTIKATAELARGMAAERDNNLVEALAHFTQAVNADANQREAALHVQNFENAIPTGSIRERANFAIAQKEKWIKIFHDLQVYINENLFIVVYDFSTVKDTIHGTNVSLQISPGIKVLLNRNTLLVWKTVLENWLRVLAVSETSNLWQEINVPSQPKMSSILIGLYDDFSDRISYKEIDNFSINSVSIVSTSSVYAHRWLSPQNIDYFQVLAQQKYYDNRSFDSFSFYMSIGNITSDYLTPRIEKINGRDINGNNFPVFTVAEWQQWLVEQGR